MEMLRFLRRHLDREIETSWPTSEGRSADRGIVSEKLFNSVSLLTWHWAGSLESAWNNERAGWRGIPAVSEAQIAM